MADREAVYARDLTPQEVEALHGAYERAQPVSFRGRRWFVTVEGLDGEERYFVLAPSKEPRD